MTQNEVAHRLMARDVKVGGDIWVCGVNLFRSARSASYSAFFVTQDRC